MTLEREPNNIPIELQAMPKAVTLQHKDEISLGAIVRKLERS